MLKVKIFYSYQRAIDFCFEHGISISRIDKYSHPESLSWIYKVRYDEEEKSNDTKRKT